MREGDYECILFQSTPLREGRHSAQIGSSGDFAFQSTPLREGRRLYDRRIVLHLRNFNPRPSVRGDEPRTQTRRGR